MTTYNKLNDKFADTTDRIGIINGLLMAQAMCARKLLECNDQSILDIMGNIVKAIESLKDTP